MLIPDDKLRKLLLDANIIDARKLESAAAEAKDQETSLSYVLTERDLIGDEDLGVFIADALKVPFVRLSQILIPHDILTLIPEVVARKQKVIAFKKDSRGLHLAMADPTNLVIAEFIEKKAGLPIIPYLATTADITNAFSYYSKNLNKLLNDLISGSVKASPRPPDGEEPKTPIIQLVDTIIVYAYQNNASDIHIEPHEDNALVRFRIDGILHDIVKLPMQMHPEVVTRIKVLSKLRTDEHQESQDGKLQFKADEEELDIRVSIVPITEGEKVVLRILSAHVRQLTLTTLGLEEDDLVRVQKAYEKPYGMILATGPTGCGKTTTMYAILKLLNKRDINIMTIEDPVEYEIPHVNQIQVNPKTNLTFAQGLRSILRQDPNVILVGEIRDEDTSDIAINAAMTGHLVLSTLHTNDAATTIPRLLDMGVEPFLVASTVNVIIAQRLVRKIHAMCRVSREVDVQNMKASIPEGTIAKVLGSERVRMYVGKGCDICHNSGYEGRVGIFETLIVDESVRDAILKRDDAETIRQIAIKNGMRTMIADGLYKVKEGITTIDEVLRVTKE